MTFTAEEAIDALAPRLGYTPTREQVAVAFLDVDQAAITASAAGRVRWERWDQTSPINNVPAQDVLARRSDYQGGEIYLIYIDNGLVFFQPQAPSGGIITEETLTDVASAHVAELVNQTTRDAILDAIIAHLPAPDPAPFRGSGISSVGRVSDFGPLPPSMG